ncbi:unnamed protein product [Phytophthora lilii]|uniref:RxLR effector protein n=1 Tax=Phytophthora lilii TaxID=2077276 RepID=A0A9W6XHB1_9STRA|nr:unnamed protein product [Phytophthora lilii]
MRPHHIMLLVLAALLASVNAISLPGPKISQPRFSVSSTSFTTESKRLLRTQSVMDEEERGGILENLANLLKSRQTLALEGYLKDGESVRQVFKNLKLNTIVEKYLVEKGSAVKLLTSPKFYAWTRYVDDFNSMYPDRATTVIAALTKEFDDAELARLLQLAKSSNNYRAKKVAEELQGRQFKVWHTKDGKKTF